MREASVLQLGPALSVRGGISTVERLIVEHAGAEITLRHVATMEDGPWLHKLGVFVQALRFVHKSLYGPGPLVVHIHFSVRGSTLRKMLLAWMTLRARRPLILHAHGSTFDEFFTGLPAVLRRLLCRTFARADCFLVLSSQWKNFYLHSCGLPLSRVMVLHNPATIPLDVPTRAGRQIVQFLFLGRIGQRKGAFDLLRAFAALPPEVRARARMVFAGDGEVDALRESAKQYGDSVQVHSWLDSAQRDALLAQSDVFALPSYHEGVPMALLEAMAWGLPVITTSVGGIPDVIGDRCEGFLIAPGDGNALQAAMRTLIEDESQRLTLGRQARARAQCFNVSQYTSNLLRIYRRLLAAPRPDRAS